MLQLVSMMNTWPFAVSSEWQAMPRPLVSRYSLGRLGSFAFAGRVALLRQELDQTAFLNEDWTQVLNSFRWAVCGRQDRCAVIALRALIYHSVTNSRAFDLIDSELTLLNQSNELLRHLACHGLSRTLQFLLLSKSTFVKSLQKHLDEAEVFALFELSTMNSCAAGGLAVLRYCSENDIPPPAIIARNMPLITFHDILRVLPRSIVRRGAKRGQLNLYYSTQKVYPRAAGELCSTTRFLLEPSVLVANEQKAVQSIPIILEMGKENAVTISQAQAFEPKARPSVVIIRARGKIAAFRTSNKLTISG